MKISMEHNILKYELSFQCGFDSCSFFESVGAKMCIYMYIEDTKCIVYVMIN